MRQDHNYTGKPNFLQAYKYEPFPIFFSEKRDDEETTEAAGEEQEDNAGGIDDKEVHNDKPANLQKDTTTKDKTKARKRKSTDDVFGKITEKHNISK